MLKLNYKSWVFLPIALLLASCSGDPNERANTLFSEATELIRQAEKASSSKRLFDLLREANERIDTIKEDYPASDLAVKLTSGQPVGYFSEIDLEEAMIKAGCKVAQNMNQRGRYDEAVKVLLPLREVAQNISLDAGADWEDTREELLDEINRVLRDIAVAQADWGDHSGAFDIADIIPSGWYKTQAIEGIAKAQYQVVMASAKAGDFEAALNTAKLIRDRKIAANAFSGIAVTQANSGDYSGAISTAELARDDEIKAKALGEISAIQYREVMANIEAGNFEAALNTAKLIPNDESKAKTLREVATAQILSGDVVSALNTAGRINETDFHNLLGRVAANDAEAQFNLGVIYQDGLDVRKDDSMAIKWYYKAAEQGHADAQFHLGRMYTRGLGVKQDHSTAIEWYRKAAEQGDADAQFNLGVMYRKGQGVKEDYVTAVKWYRKAAEQDHAKAQTNLGVMYDNGWGVRSWDVRKNHLTAAEWYRKAAEQGDAIAQFNLGRMYAKGLGVEQDHSAAVEWYRKAAEQGHARAVSCRSKQYQNC